MNIREEFKEAVEKNDLTTVRVMIKGSFVIDPTFKKLNEYIKYAEDRLPDLYEEHDDDEFENSDWNKDYMNKQLNKLMYNFSKERIAHLKEVCKSIYGERIERIEQRRKEEENKQTKSINSTQIATGTVVVGASLFVGGLICAKTAIAIGGAVLLAGGGISLVKKKLRSE